MEKMGEQKFDLKSFKTIGRAISTYEDMQLLLQHLVEGICRTFKIKGSSILLYDESDKQLYRVSSHGLSQNYLRKGAVYMADEYKEFSEGRLIVHSDLKNDMSIQYAEAAEEEGISTIVSIPIKYKNSIVGLLKNYHSDDLLPHDEDLDSIAALMEQLGLAIELNGLQNFMLAVSSAMDNIPSRTIPR